MNRIFQTATVHRWRVLTALATATATLMIAAPADAAGTRTPVGHWALEAIPGVVSRDGALADSNPIGQDSPLTATDTAWHADARMFGSEALGFNGASSVAATAGPVLDTTASFSVAAWVRPADLSADRDILGQDYATSADANKRGGFSVGIRHHGPAAHWSFRMGNGPSRHSPAVTATDPNPLTAGAVGRWTHIAASYDADSQLMTLYVNGLPAAQAQRTATPWAATGPFTVGRSDDGGPAHFWHGEVVRAYAHDRVLTTADLLGGDVGGFSEPGMLAPFWAGEWSFSSAAPCYVPEIPDVCNAPTEGTFSHNLRLTLGTEIAGDRVALAFDGAAYVFDADFNQVFNPDGTPATQPSTEYGYVDRPVVHTNDAFSVTALVRISEPDRPGPQTVVSLGAPGARSAFNLAYADGAYTATLAGSATPGDEVTVSAPVGNPGAWHQLLAVYDPHQSRLQLYLDGAPVASTTASTSWDGGGGLEVGRATTGNGYLYGAIDNLYLWQGVVTERQIAALADWPTRD